MSAWFRFLRLSGVSRRRCSCRVSGVRGLEPGVEVTILEIGTKFVR